MLSLSKQARRGQAHVAVILRQAQDDCLTPCFLLILRQPSFVLAESALGRRDTGRRGKKPGRALHVQQVQQDAYQRGPDHELNDEVDQQEKNQRDCQSNPDLSQDQESGVGLGVGVIAPDKVQRRTTT